MTGKDAKTKTSWKDTVTVYLQLPILQVFLLGIASGFPLLLTGSTLAARLFESGIDLKAIGAFASIGLPYTLKFLAAPFVDTFHLPGIKSHLAHRKSWCILFQIGTALSLLGMSFVDPTASLLPITILAFCTASFSAMQDVVIDALRVEILKKDDQGAGAAASVAGYRVGMLLAGAGAFFLATYAQVNISFIDSWNFVYLTSFFVMAACTAVTISIKHLNGYEEQINSVPDKTSDKDDDTASNIETSDIQDTDKTRDNIPHQPPKSLKQYLYQAIIAPFVDFLTRPGAVAILLFIMLFKLGDAMASTLSGVFYLDLGFTKVEIAAIQKVIGLVATLGGAFIGGFVVKRMTILNSLILCGILQILSNFIFVWLDHVGASVPALTVCIIVENVTGGMGTAAFVAYMSQLCNAKFTATQYALLSSLSSIGRTLFASTAGILQAINGWSSFFIITAGLGVPGMILIYFVQNKANEKKAEIQ